MLREPSPLSLCILQMTAKRHPGPLKVILVIMVKYILLNESQRKFTIVKKQYVETDINEQNKKLRYAKTSLDVKYRINRKGRSGKTTVNYLLIQYSEIKVIYQTLDSRQIIWIKYVTFVEQGYNKSLINANHVRTMFHIREAVCTSKIYIQQRLHHPKTTKETLKHHICFGSRINMDITSVTQFAPENQRTKIGRLFQNPNNLKSRTAEKQGSILRLVVTLLLPQSQKRLPGNV